MAKLTLTPITTVVNAPTAINANNTATETALENTLSRDGTAPNAMNADFDMNGNSILNLPYPQSPLEPVRLIDVGGYLFLEVSTVMDELRGGNTDQYLAKTSDSDFDFEWRDLSDAGGTVTEHIIIACSDEVTSLTTGTAKATFRVPYAFTLTDVRASLATAATGATLLTVDVNDSGTSILSTKLIFDSGEKTTVTAATQRVISDTSLADDAEITIDIDAVGNTIAGKGLKVTLIGYRTS